ncbi:hypothetical protein ACFO0N_06355 [Halobium salinum]|uniref:Uncharacterized protein n=1 Tax=Halobium salinum TaxID=1364940 RepID=A0ABD5P9W8_9EURY|nr:hypothetical protein [Halobium salinum]
MTNVGPGFVYGLFALAALPLLALPVTFLAHLLRRPLGGFGRGLAGALAVPLVVGGFLAGLTGLDLDTASIPLLLGGAYVLVPLGVGWTVLLAVGADAEVGLRWAVDGWVVATTLATLATFVGFGMVRFVTDTPSLFGVAWFGGYLAYLVGVGALGGVLGSLAYRWRRGASTTPTGLFRRVSR